jgi:hypothetical protein
VLVMSLHLIKITFQSHEFSEFIQLCLLVSQRSKAEQWKRHTVHVPHLLDRSIIIFSTKRRASGIPLAPKAPARCSIALKSNSARSASLKDPDSVLFKLGAQTVQTGNRNPRKYTPAKAPFFYIVPRSYLINHLSESLLRHLCVNKNIPYFVI